MSDITTPRGRGLVISGALVAGVPLVFAIVWATFAAASGVFGDALIMLTTIGLPFVSPTWFLGVALLAIGRSRQRGPVKASVLAWIVALAAVPAAFVAFLFVYSNSLAASYADASEPLPPIGNYAVVALTPLAIVASLVAVAWLVWGKPAQSASINTSINTVSG